MTKLQKQIGELRVKLLEAVAEIGSVASELREADEWARLGDDGNGRANAICSLESVSAGCVEATNHLRAVSLKCEELIERDGQVHIAK